MIRPTEPGPYQRVATDRRRHNGTYFGQGNMAAERKLTPEAYARKREFYYRWATELWRLTGRKEF